MEHLLADRELVPATRSIDRYGGNYQAVLLHGGTHRLSVDAARQSE